MIHLSDVMSDRVTHHALYISTKEWHICVTLCQIEWHSTPCISRPKNDTSVWRYVRSSVTQHALYISNKEWHICFTLCQVECDTARFVYLDQKMTHLSDIMSGLVSHCTPWISRPKNDTSVWHYVRSSVTQHALYISTKERHICLTLCQVECDTTRLVYLDQRSTHLSDIMSGREWHSMPCISILAACKPTNWAVHLAGPTDATGSRFEAWSEYSFSCVTHCLDVCLFSFRLPGSFYFIFPWSSSQHKATCVITLNHIYLIVWWTVFLWCTVANNYAVNVKWYSILPDSVYNHFYVNLINAYYDITWQWL